METVDCEKHSITGLLGGFPGKKATQSEMVPDEVEDPHWCDDHSVAEHLDSLRDSSSLLRRNSKMNSRTRGKRMQVFSRRSISQLGDRTVDCEDLEPVGSGSSSDNEEPQWPQSNQKRGNGGRERKIIFNPRVCCDVDIEVGSSIRIHPPWKEVQVGGNDESIILSTYFSQIST
ncbi:hypothetical protein CISIN_1g030704mg [Citrus sinensis]|uniref:Uncharacterized protein n=1 Tax=Citrus sinensis TaxID=2711 RepID=A0A067F5F9_CITSI|nr:hypothetical protein CISIN_1g030704mg [Citrus sinensis]